MGNYQLASQIGFYPNYLLYAYASGMIEIAYTDTNLTQEQLFNLINLNPSKISTFDVNESNFIKFKVNHSFNADFFMTLGHDFTTQNQNLTLEGDGLELSTSQIVNSNVGNDCEYNGWSLVGLNNDLQTFDIVFNQNNNNSIGTFLLGRKFVAPQNVDVSQTHSVSYGYKK